MIITQCDQLSLRAYADIPTESILVTVLHLMVTTPIEYAPRELSIVQRKASDIAFLFHLLQKCVSLIFNTGSLNPHLLSGLTLFHLAS